MTTERNIPKPSEAVIRARLSKKIQDGASWLYWVAAISVANTILLSTGISFRLSFGLGVSDLVYVAWQNQHPARPYLGVAVDALLVFAIVVLGYFASHERRWAFIAGLGLISLDTILLIAFVRIELVLSIIIHVCTVVGLWRGLSAAIEHEKLSHSCVGGA